MTLDSQCWLTINISHILVLGDHPRICFSHCLHASTQRLASFTSEFCSSGDIREQAKRRVAMPTDTFAGNKLLEAVASASTESGLSKGCGWVRVADLVSLTWMSQWSSRHLRYGARVKVHSATQKSVHKHRVNEKLTVKFSSNCNLAFIPWSYRNLDQIRIYLGSKLLLHRDTFLQPGYILRIPRIAL